MTEAFFGRCDREMRVKQIFLLADSSFPDATKELGGSKFFIQLDKLHWPMQ